MQENFQTFDGVLMFPEASLWGRNYILQQQDAYYGSSGTCDAVCWRKKIYAFAFKGAEFLDGAFGG